MSFFGEIISLAVAVSWTVTALSAEVASKRIGSLQLNVFRMVLSLVMLSLTLWAFTGCCFPVGAGGKAWFWLSLSGFVGTCWAIIASSIPICGLAPALVNSL